MGLLSSRRARHVLTASGGTIAGSAAGAFLPFVIAALYQAKRDTDAYFLAVGTTLFLVGLFGIVLVTLIVPYVVEQRRLGPEHLRLFVRRTLVQGAILSVLATGLMLAAMRYAVLPRTSFDAEQRHDAMTFLLLLSPLPAAMTVGSGLQGVLYAFERFALSSYSQVFRAGGGIVAAILFHRSVGLAAVPVGLVVGELVRVGLLAAVLSGIVGRGEQASDGKRSAAPPTVGFWRAASPQILSMVIIGVNPVVDKVVSARLDVGAVTLLELCEKLYYTPFSLISSGIAVVFGASWAVLAQEPDRREELRRDYRRTQNVVVALSTLVCLVMIAAVWLFRFRLADLLAISNPHTFAATFSCYAVGLPAAMYANLGVRLIVAFRHTKILPVFAGVALVVNTVFDIVGAYLFGVAGVALAFALHRLTAAALSFVITRRLLLADPVPPPVDVPRARRRRLTSRLGSLVLRAALVAGVGALAVGCGLALVVRPSLGLVVFYAASLPLLLALPMRWMPSAALTTFALLPVSYLAVPTAFRTFSPVAWVVIVWALRVFATRAVAGAAPGPRLPRVLPLLAVFLVVDVALSANRTASIRWTTAFTLLVLLPPVLLRMVPLDRGAILRPWAVLAGVLGAYAVVETFGLQANPLMDWLYHSAESPLIQRWSVYRATTTLGHPLLNALFFAVGTVISLTQWQRTRRVPDALLCVCAAAGLLATASRGGLAAVIAGGAIVALLPRAQGARAGRGPRRLTTVVMVLVIGAAAMLTYVGDRSSSSEGQDSSAARSERLDRGLEVGRSHLLTGVGPGGAAEAVHTRRNSGTLENAWLELFVATGITGFALTVLLLGQAGVRAARGGAAPLAGALVTYAVAASGFNLLEGNPPAMIMLGLLLGAALATGPPRPAPARESVPERSAMALAT